ncbi:MAG TPA: DUF1648 domain-containing protein [Herpetosiphonaceae bacterium]
MSKVRLAYAGLIGAALLQGLYFYPKLPDTIASHYSARGYANAWATRPVFFIGYGLVLGLMLALFAGLPPLFGRMPDWMINLPNKDYWLAPERRAQTMALFASQMRWFGVATLAELILVFQLVISANLPGSAGFPVGLAGLAFVAFLAFVFVWTVRMLLAWRLPKG